METYERNPTQHLLPIPTNEVNIELGEKMMRNVMCYLTLLQSILSLLSTNATMLVILKCVYDGLFSKEQQLLSSYLLQTSKHPIFFIFL